MRHLEPGDSARHAAGSGAYPKDLRRASVELDLDRIHLANRPIEPVTGDRDEEIVQAHLPRGRGSDKQETTATRTGERALRDPRHERGGDARVDRVAAFAQHVGA